jgi:hypothetical protein
MVFRKKFHKEAENKKTSRFGEAFLIRIDKR